MAGMILFVYVELDDLLPCIMLYLKARGYVFSISVLYK